MGQEIDRRWEKIRKDYSLPNIPIQGDFILDYLKYMKELVDSIRSNPYTNTLDKDSNNKLITDLYDLGRMFNGIYYYAKLYYQVSNEHKETKEKYKSVDSLGFQWLSGLYSPGLHNYNQFLRDYIMTPALYEHYYSKMVDSIEEFILSGGENLPKYLYNIETDKDKFIVITYEYFTNEDIPIDGDDLLLPQYHPINGEIGTLDQYEKIYFQSLSTFSMEKKFEAFEKFKKSEYPILKWISSTKDLSTYDVFPRKVKEDSKFIVFQYLATLKSGDIANKEYVKYNYGISMDEIDHWFDYVVREHTNMNYPPKLRQEDSVFYKI